MSDLLTIQDPLAEAEATINILVGKPDDTGQRQVTVAAGLPGQAPIIITADLDALLEATPIRQAWLAYGAHTELTQAVTDIPIETENRNVAEETTDTPPTEKSKPKPQTNLNTLF
ncbi:MAG: hypothetical protein GY792_07280 [Gammaproteobacteria bacterium]|nr:hypothetical protein [Gammaproteobacteria bacterium]